MYLREKSEPFEGDWWVCHRADGTGMARLKAGALLFPEDWVSVARIKVLA